MRQIKQKLDWALNEKEKIGSAKALSALTLDFGLGIDNILFGDIFKLISSVFQN